MDKSIWHTFDELPIDYMWESARADDFHMSEITLVVLVKGWDSYLGPPIEVGRPRIESDIYGREHLMMHVDEEESSPIENIDYWAYSEDYYCEEMFRMYPQTDELRESLKILPTYNLNKNARSRQRPSGQNQNPPEHP